MKAPRIVLVYHGVQPDHPACLPPDLFARQMTYLAKNFPVLPLGEMIQNGGRERRRAVSVTFDDGYRNFIDYALPLLKKHHLPCTVYIPTRYIGQRNEWDRDLNAPLLPLMSERELLAIREEGVSLGSHTQSHRRLRGLPQAELEREVTDSKKFLEDLLGARIDSFSYPYGSRVDFDESAVRAVKAAGYAEAVTTYFGRFNDLQERFKIRRITIPPRMPLWKFILVLDGCYDWIASRERVTHFLRARWGRGTEC